MIFDEMDENGYHMMDWWWDVFGPNAWIFMMLGWVIFFGIAILLAYYVHKYHDIMRSVFYYKPKTLEMQAERWRDQNHK